MFRIVILYNDDMKLFFVKTHMLFNCTIFLFSRTRESGRERERERGSEEGKREAERVMEGQRGPIGREQAKKNM